MQLKDVNPDITIEERTATSGSEPEEISEKMDEQLAKSSAADEDEKQSSESSTADKEVPWHKDPRFKKDLALLKTAKSILQANDIDDLDELVEMVEKGRKVKGKSIDLDRLDEIVEKAKRLERYEEYWAQQQEMQKRQEEDPEDTIKRLEKELRKLEGKEKAKAERDKQAAEAKQAVEFYERAVSEIVEDVEEVPKEYHKFVSLVLGVQNPTNDIDITDRRQIKKAAKEVIKSIADFANAMKKLGAEEYRKGKLEIPKVESASTGTPAAAEKKIYLKDARKALLDKFLGASG
jgi:hypothetical protein